MHGLGLACVLCKYDELATGVSPKMSHKSLKPNADPTTFYSLKSFNRPHEFVALLVVQ